MVGRLHDLARLGEEGRGMKLFKVLVGGCLLALFVAGGAGAQSSMAKDREKACRVTAETTYKNLRVAQEIHYVDEGSYTTDLNALIEKGYNPSHNAQVRLLSAQKDGWTVEITVIPCGLVVSFDSREMD
jgi:hypothetical protein